MEWTDKVTTSMPPGKISWCILCGDTDPTYLKITLLKCHSAIYTASNISTINMINT